MISTGPSEEAALARDGDRALRAAARNSGGRTAAVGACSIGAALAALAEPAVLGHCLDLLLRGDPAGPVWTLWCAVVIAAEVLLDAAVTGLTGRVNGRSTAWLRRLGLAALLGTAPHHADRHSPGDLAARLTAHATEAGTVPAAAAGGVASLLPPLGGLIALFVIDTWTALAFVAGLPLLAVLLRSFARDSGASVARYQQVQLAMAGRLVEALAGARTIAAAGTLARERARILRELPVLGAEGRLMWRVYGGTTARTSALMPLLLYVVLGVGGMRLASGALGVGALLAAVRYAGLAAGVGAVTGRLAAVVRGRAAARRTAALFGLPHMAYGEEELPPGGPGTLELRGVRVERAGRTVLDGVDLVVPGGSTAAVVGRSGSGKTLLAAVAGRLTDPDGGRVLLDGVPLDALSAAALRRDVGHAFARPVLPGRSVADAISFGAGPEPGREEVGAAARAAGADPFVRRLPEGYDTALAEAPMSGGEVQRLGLARAFAHAGRLLVLDDATSSLDTLTAREVERALAERVRPGTRLVIAHRISSAARADLVIWLEEGRVRATGPHATLWQDPAYRAVFAPPPEHAPREQAPPEHAAREPESAAREPESAAREPESAARERRAEPAPVRAAAHTPPRAPEAGPGPSPEPGPPRGAEAGRGAWGRVAREGRAFLRGRGRVLGALGLWSLLEAAHTFLGGYGVARALDDGFLAGRTATGVAWLAAAGAGALLGGIALRGVFAALADLVEPLRDGLVRRAVRGALGAAVADPARAADAGAVSRLTQQTEMARDSFAGLVLTARSFVFTAAGALVGMAALAPVLLLVVLPPLLLGLAAFLATLRPMAALQRDALDTDEALAGRVGEVAAGLRDIVACGGGAAVSAGVEPLIARQESLTGRLARWGAVRTLALGVAGRAPVVALLAATPWLLAHGLTAGALAGALTYLTQSLLPSLDTLMAALGSAGTRLLVVLDRFCGAGQRAPDPAEPAPARTPAPEGAPAAELRGVRFAYGPHAHPVLDGLDLAVRPGEHLAVVGPSGIGKSTLTALLAGLLPPGRGTVLVAGAPALTGSGGGQDTRRTLLPQQAYVFTGTVRENLTHLSPGSVSGARLEDAVAALGLEGLLGRLGGPDAVLDPLRLSQGERQLLALAAAYLSPAPLLLLDEATCHLDPEAEERAERALAARPGTLVVVAHRISSAARADRVLVLDGSRALCGTHEELPARSALYRDLVGMWSGDGAVTSR
ncbi:ATP-binding cassette domain-containing protein [Streptomyces sp. G-G2]|uniref:ATP-binding cassette domain-containing protein n=1 Tax=Streptomyces sp. G-G2 TaxID=3046201 RepID=UPI0024BAEB78|nr:ATP-binding cassette domain-containing protein [Streptomyces sp. G-G2]MDJ0385039.1 ATP-binding cassette domain-containing protein [Streptomyces sp. G-G2]